MVPHRAPARGIGDVDCEALRDEEAHEPAAHLAAAADHEGALPGAASSRLDALALLQVSDERMSASSSSASGGGTFARSACARARSMTSRSWP